MFWGLPIALTVVAVLLLPLTPSVVYWVIGLAAMGLALGFSLAGIYYTVDPFQPGYRLAFGAECPDVRSGIGAVPGGLSQAWRSIVSATEVMLVSGLLALELLRGSERPTVLVALYAGITGLVLGQATWALNYWRLDSLTGGLVLMIGFYNVVGLAQHGLQGRIRRRVVLEYGLITVAALALIWEIAPQIKRRRTCMRKPLRSRRPQRFDFGVVCHADVSVVLSDPREAPSEEQRPGFQLLVRAGLVRSLGGGYAILPLGIRTRQRIEAVVCDALSAAGGLPVSLRLVRSAEQAAAVLSDADSRPIRFRDRAGRRWSSKPGMRAPSWPRPRASFNPTNSFLSCCTRPAGTRGEERLWEGCSAPARGV